VPTKTVITTITTTIVRNKTKMLLVSKLNYSAD